jgi:hypothetical protein
MRIKGINDKVTKLLCRSFFKRAKQLESILRKDGLCKRYFVLAEKLWQSLADHLCDGREFLPKLQAQLWVVDQMALGFGWHKIMYDQFYDEWPEA